ncbi:hypothetical protein FCIRC_2951 [Fusarium circinatum]|uniref:Uncharacterized protein n=1 Tax=Fusarium circinatum TaxID=48490 RepID=A0A8H5UEB5_FUSCI|nr:hypothetical protein FCIRC_2951 [Fusarium circinatum]
MDPSLPPVAFQGARLFILKMNQRLEQLYLLGVLRVKLQANADGLPSFVAMPDSPLDFSVPTDYDRKDLSAELQRLFTAGAEDIATKAMEQFHFVSLQISADINAMHDFLVKSTTSVTARELAVAGHTLTRYHKTMARIIRDDSPIPVGENSPKLINDFCNEMVKAGFETQRAYALGFVARAAEHVEQFLEWQLNGDLLVSMKQAMFGFVGPSGDEEVRSEQEAN